MLLAFLLTLAAQAQQRKVKLYAYSQPVTPGIQKARDIDENGNRVPATAGENGTNLLLYAVSSSPARVYPVALWIRGERHGVRLQAVAKTPVTHTNYNNPQNPKTTVLVPATRSKVLQLVPTDTPDGKEYPAAEKLAGSNDVVFVFKQNGKFFYQPVTKFTTLEAAALQ